MQEHFLNKRGIALILTLMIIAIVVPVTLHFNRTRRTDLIAAANMRDSITLRYSAKSGVNYALAVLTEDADNNNYDTLQEDWADSTLLSERASSLEGLEDVRFNVSVSDCTGKIQINKLIDGNNDFVTIQKDLLQRFLSLSEFNLDAETVTDMIDALKDWIDTDDSETGLGGAEDSYYQSQDPSYACNDGPVRTLTSLRKVRGFSDIAQETFDKIVKHLTPHGDGKININTADPLILEALSGGIGSDLANDMDEYRREKGNDLSTSTWYKNVSGMGGVTIPSELITTQSTIFSISCESSSAAARGRNSLTKRVTGVIERIVSGGQLTLNILYWHVVE